MRHGQTAWNLQGLVQGRTDIPLNNTGRQQAHDAAEQFKEIGHEWDLVVSSTLRRAEETARIVSEVLNIPYGGKRSGLVEQNYGDAEGALVNELHETWPDRNFPNGEPDDAVGSRGLRALDELLDDYPENRILAVSHGGLIRRLIATTIGEAYEHVPRIPNVSVSTLRRDPESWAVVTVAGTPIERAISLP